ncbi:hypothetical protein, partial [Kiloniella laminariae]|uniref:hypothetical protein n=1 Tax=Kiloniella laminariae TaxID=454162 RepID=UPI000368B808
TRSTDAKRTEDALSAIERNEIKSEHQLKNYLNPQAVSITDKRAIYVGVDDYRAAGGATVTDLFSTEVLFEDSELLAKLYNDKLLAAAAEIQAEGWAWVECYYKPHIWYPIQEEKLEKLKPVGNQFSEEETKEFAQLKAKEIEEGLDDEENARLDYYEDQEVDIFSEQQKSVSGGYVYLNELGELQTSLGLVKRSHVPEAVKLGFLKEKPKDTSKAKPKGEYSQALKDDLRRARLGSLQKALLEKPELVLDLLAFSLCEKSSGSGYSPLDIKIGRPENKPNTETGFEFDTRLTHPADPYSWGNGDFITVEDKVSAFSEFQSKGQKHRDTVITEGLARTFWDYGKELTGKVECLSGANLRSVWTPTSENFFKRVSADDLDQIYRDVMGQGASKDFFSMKKKGKVEALDTLFNDPEVIQALSDDQREKIATWEPKK